MHIYCIFIIYYFQTLYRNIAGYDWVTTKGSINQFVAPWINDSSLCHTNQSVPVAVTSLYGGQVLVMRNDCQSHIIDFHESTVTDVEIPFDAKYNNSLKCWTVLGLFNTYMIKVEGVHFQNYTLVRLHTWEWLAKWRYDDPFLCTVNPDKDLINPWMTAPGTDKEHHKLFFDLGNRFSYNCSTNKCTNVENRDFSAADVHGSIPSNVQVFEFGDTIYTIYHLHNDSGKHVVNVRDIRNSTNVLIKPSPSGLRFKFFAVNISTKYAKEACHHVVNITHKVICQEHTNSSLCSSNDSSSAKLHMAECRKPNHENDVIPVVITIIASCITVALLVTVFIQRAQLVRSRNKHACCHNANATTSQSLLEMPPQAAPKDTKTTALAVTNNVQDHSNQSSSKSMEIQHDVVHERLPILVNLSPINLAHTTPTNIKSNSDVTQSLSTGDLTCDSSTVKSIGEHLKKWMDVNIAPPTPHPDTSNLQSISTNIPTGPLECMNPRAEKTTSNDHDPQSLGQWPIQFMMRVLRDKRRSRKPNI